MNFWRISKGGQEFLKIRKRMERGRLELWGWCVCDVVVMDVWWLRPRLKQSSMLCVCAGVEAEPQPHVQGLNGKRGWSQEATCDDG